MDDNDVDIYDDINDFDLGEEIDKLKAENETLREQIRFLEADVAKLTGTIDDLKENEETLRKNISTLYLTAKAEIDRKDRMLTDLRTERDNICFRRFNKPENKRGRADNFSESNIAKKFKSDCDKVSTTNNEAIESDVMGVIEIKDDDSENNVPRTSKYDSCKLKVEQFDNRLHEGYKPTSGHSGEKENIVVDKYRDKRTTQEFGDRYCDKNRSSSGPGNRYNNVHRSRSKSVERNERYNENRESRYYNHEDNFYFRDERARSSRDRENWTNNRYTRRGNGYRNSGSRDFRDDYSRTFDRTGKINGETPPCYRRDDKRDDHYYEDSKRDVKLEKNGSKPDVKVSRKGSFSESIHEYPTERTMTKNVDNPKIKPEKKRLKMLDKVEKQIRGLRATPIKKQTRPAEQAPIDNHLKEASRNITKEIEGNERRNKISKEFTPELSTIEHPKKNISKKVVGQYSKIEVNRRNNENVLYINASDDDYIDTQSEDFIIVDESLSSESNVKKEADEKCKLISDISDDELTKAAILDVQLAVKYHTDKVIPFQLSKDLPYLAQQADTKEETNNFSHPKQNQNIGLEATEEWKNVKLDEKQNISDPSGADKSKHEHVESRTGKDKTSEVKKKINILSNIAVTHAKNNIKMITEELTEEQVKVCNQPVIEKVNIPKISNFDNSNHVDRGKQLVTKVKDSPHENLLDAEKDCEKDTSGSINWCSNQGLNKKKSSNVNLDSGNSAKGEEIKTKKQHKSLLKEYISKHGKLAIENQREEEKKNIKLSNQNSTFVDVLLNNPDAVDNNIATKEKLKRSSRKNSTSITLNKTVENIDEDKIILFKKQDVNVNEKKEAVKTTQQPALPNIVEEEKTAKNSKHQGIDTKSIKNVTNKKITFLSNEYEETKNPNKSDNQSKKKDGVSKIMASNIVFDSENSTRGKKKEGSKKIKSPCHKDVTDGTKREVKMEEIITDEKKCIESAIADPCIKKKTGNVQRPKPRSNSTSSNSSNTNLTKDKKEIRRNSVSKDSTPNSSEQSKSTVVQECIKDGNAYVSRFKEQEIHPFELSLNPELYADNFPKDEKKKIKGLIKKSVSATKQNTTDENKNTQKKVIRSESEDKAKEKKKSPPKECLSNVKGDITEEKKDIKEDKRQTGNKNEESLNVRLVFGNSSHDGKKLPEDKNVKQPSKHKTKHAPAVSGDQENKDMEIEIQDSPIDLSTSGQQDMGEKESSIKQSINKEFPNTSLDVENTMEDSRKRSGSKTDFIKSSKDTDDSLKGVKEGTDSTQLGFKEVKECSKESIQKLMKAEDKSYKDQLKRKVTEKCVDIPNKLNKDTKNKRNSPKYQKAKHIKRDQTSSESVECISKEVKKIKAELQNFYDKDKASQAVVKQDNEQIICNSEDIKKNKEDSKDESTDTATSGETVDLKIMKFSDMKNILRGSIEEPAVCDTSADINAKKFKGAKNESPNIKPSSECSRSEPKKTDPVIPKNEEHRGSDCVGKSKECVSDNTISTCRVESRQADNSKSLKEKLFALIGSYSDDSDLANSSENANNSSVDRENINDSGNTAQATNDNTICDVNTRQQRKDDCDITENKNVPSIPDPPATDSQTISKNSLINNQTSVLKNTQNVSPEKPKIRRRITPTPVKADKPVCNFKNILAKTSQSIYAQTSPLHLTHEGEIPVLHLEENHINNLPTETDINNKNIISLLDTMNISNMECDISKITCETTENEANLGDGHLNVSPIKGSKSLTFENVISKVTSTPVPRKCQNEESVVSNSNGSENVVGGGVICDAAPVTDSLTCDKKLSTDVRSSTTIRRGRRRCRMVITD